MKFGLPRGIPRVSPGISGDTFGWNPTPPGDRFVFLHGAIWTLLGWGYPPVGVSARGGMRQFHQNGSSKTLEIIILVIRFRISAVDLPPEGFLKILTFLYFF